MLVISREQQRLLAENLFPHKILAFLKEQLPEKCDKPDAVLLESIRGYIETAREQDIRTERALAKWSYLSLLTDGKLPDIQGVGDYLKQPHPSQSEKMDRLMKSMAVATKLTVG
ncbi:hypothetical protein [Candidatus Thiosymbion oneisti]|uniref:hypothetical protein n=1 Tax=Candidatus Thiosymbion oneisti TaxID=589554 RepID=UPI00105F68FE|nr:hypothetical protein [Candidatus Thiosymbion oneisti]